jgi:hypothetical protein
MANRLETVEAFLQGNQDNAHLHMAPSEARAFYAAVVGEELDSRSVLDIQKIVLGCVVCSAVLAEIQPGVPAVGRNTVS